MKKRINCLGHLGRPNCHIAGLQIWILGREEGDEDWLRVTLHCNRDSSEVWVLNQSALNVRYDIENLISELGNLNKKINKTLIYDFIEP